MRLTLALPGAQKRAPLVALGLISIVTSAASAQEATVAQATPGVTAPGQSAGDVPIADVIVTSQKRSEDIRKVPLSVSVLSGEDLQAQQITDYPDLTRALPNVSFSSQAGEGLSTIEIRGISSQAGTATVATYLDDVSLTTRNLYSQGTVEPRFFDLARIEVLRGPQGTLYGASAMGGTIRYISNQPQMSVFTTEAYSELSGTDGGGVNYDERLIMNAPLSDKAAIRLGYETGGDSGYINLVSPDNGATIKDGIDSTNWNVVKFAIRVEPADGITITPALFFQKYVSHDIDASYLALSKDQTSKLVAEPGHDTLFVPSLTVNADVGFGDVTSVTAGYNRWFERTQDTSSVNNIAPYLLTSSPTFASAVGALPSATYLNNVVHQYSEELRIASKPYEQGELPITWLAGLFYSDEHTTVSDNEPVFGINKTFQQFGYSTNDPTVLSGAFPNDFFNDLSYFSRRYYDTRQAAIFGEGTYFPWPNVRLTIGGRYLYARDVLDRVGDYYFASGPQQSNAISHYYAFTPKFAAGWDVTPEVTVYANATKGYRLGSENRPVPIYGSAAAGTGTAADFAALGISGAPASFGADKLWNLEIGEKARLLDGRLLADLSAFYIKWDNIQQDVVLPISGYDFETNAGSAKSYGGELALEARVASGVTVSASGGYTHATLDSGVVVGGVLLNGSFPNERVAGVPEYNATIGVNYAFEVNDETIGFVRGDAEWVGDSHGTLVTTNPDYKRPSYITANARAGLSWGRYEVAAFIRNLSNNDKIIQRPNIQSVVEGYRLRPLTAGIGATVKF